MTARAQGPGGGDDIPDDLRKAIAKATAPKAEDRYQSTKDFAADLERVLRQMPDVPSPPHVPSPPSDDRIVPIWVLPLGVLGMLLLVALFSHLGLI